MRVRLMIVVISVVSVLMSVVSPVSAQEPTPESVGDGGTESGSAGEIVDFDPSKVESPPPLADGVVHPEAIAAAEAGFDGSSIEPSAPNPDGVVVTGPARVDGVDNGSDMAPGRPESSDVPEWATRGLDQTSDETAEPPAAIAPGRRLRFEADGAETTDTAAGVGLDPIDDGEAALSGMRLVRPESDRAVGLSVATLDNEATAAVSNAGLGMVLELDRPVGGGRPVAPPGLDRDGGRPDVALGARTGWELHVDLNMFGDVVLDPLEVGFVINFGCNPAGVCRSAQDLPTRIDEEAAVAVVELPANVLASLVRPGAPGRGPSAMAEAESAEGSVDAETTTTTTTGSAKDPTTTAEANHGAAPSGGSTTTTAAVDTGSDSTAVDSTTTTETSAGSSSTSSSSNDGGQDAGDEAALDIHRGAGAGMFSAPFAIPRPLVMQSSPDNNDSGVIVSAVRKAGSFAASSYSALAEWQVGLQTGHAELTYGIPVPAGTGYVPEDASMVVKPLLGLCGCLCWRWFRAVGRGVGRRSVSGSV
jgi:hypothetical protein